jgi:hypothetical protein
LQWRSPAAEFRRLPRLEEAAGDGQTFRRLKPNAQGKLALSFVPVKDYAMVNAIEVEPDEK